MSRARIDKLNVLLARVQQRSAEPRLFAVRGLGESPPEPPENTNVASRAVLDSSADELSFDTTPPPSAKEVSPPSGKQASPPSVAPPRPQVVSSPAASPFEESFADLTGSATPPAPSAIPAQPAVAREGAERPAPTLKLEPAVIPTPEPAATPGLEPVAGTPESLAPGPSSAPQRVTPSPSLAFDSAVKVVSAPRTEVAKSFGELLELSLSLRPKS